LGPIPNPQSPIPNTQYPINILKIIFKINIYLIFIFKKKINKKK